MKSKIFLLLLTLSPLLLFSSSHLPDSIIQKPWYYGTVFNKSAFVYIDESDRNTGYFFEAGTATPRVYPLTIKWKKDNPKTVSFHKDGMKIKAKFIGELNQDTISGFIITSRKNAIRLNIIPEMKLFMVRESILTPSPPPHRSERYYETVFHFTNVEKDISFGAATGYYTSMPVSDDVYDYQEIILDALERMYINPTKKAVLHLLNKDPLSLTLTDLQPLRLDIYQPLKDTLSRRPLILILHGGAFILGDKETETVRELAEDFARKGYVVASANYRIGFNPASKSSLERAAYRAVQDARAALRFLSANAHKYRIDTNWVFLAGSSAGAITALNVAFMEESERPESTAGNFWRAQVDLGGLDESSNIFSGSFTIRAVANLWGAVNDTAIIDEYENIPVLSVHGNNDRIVPYGYNYPFLDLDTTITANIVSKLYGSSSIHTRLNNLGIESRLITLENAGHEPQTEPGMYGPVMDTISSSITEFFFREMFSFPEIKGPQQIAIGMSPAIYFLPYNSDLTYYWQAEGGKILPGLQENSVRVVWLGKDQGEIKATLIHKNLAETVLYLPVSLP
jgi:acetyl esterase/lipase